MDDRKKLTGGDGEEQLDFTDEFKFWIDQPPWKDYDCAEVTTSRRKDKRGER